MRSIERIVLYTLSILFDRKLLCLGPEPVQRLWRNLGSGRGEELTELNGAH